MKVEFLQEPELEFGNGGRHIDIRFGMMHHKPLDYDSTAAPKEIKLGIIGSSETIEGLGVWLENCKQGIEAKKSKQQYLFPEFPGFGEEDNLPSAISLDDRRNVTISKKDIEKLLENEERNALIRSSVNFFIEELRYIDEKTSPDVLICALPPALLERLFVDEKDDENSSKQSSHQNNQSEVDLDFHDLFKAKAMVLRKPTQIVLPETYNAGKKLKASNRKQKAYSLQDEATRAWNLYTALYYKALGTPWRLVRDARDLTTCYVGISFYKTLDHSKLYTSTAQIFNERGEGVILRGGQAEQTKDDRQPYLPAADASELLSNALALYRREHRNLPARVVLHKTSRFIPEEFEGFQDALDKHDIHSAEFISFNRTGGTRLFRYGKYPPLRGTLLTLDDRTHVLYTRGSIDFFSTYPGMYVPRPLKFRCESVEGTPKALAQEILALTKMNWNNTQFDRGEPITIRAARQVGSILKYLSKNDPLETHYRFYM
ncbi:argonaute/piwi family protein [Coleofasciculus sp. G2-EDA-02]|uniref:argonaute/piwi family protein n=1 Tax=Coleofasciculus sp. G2-EDA-02 TaxID=3069529 RepID=UPI0032FFF9A6